MRILQIIDSLEIGGAEKLLVSSVPLIVKSGNTVDLLLLNGKITPFYQELKSMNNCRIFSLGKWVYNPFYIFKIMPFLYKYDIVHVHLFPAQYFVSLAKLLSFSRTKIVFTEHSTSNVRLQRPYFKYIEKFIYSFFSKIICITQQVKEVILEALVLREDKLVVINNGIDLEIVKNATSHLRQDYGFSRNQFIIIMVAGFRREKDQDTVIRAMKILPDDFQLIFVGDGNRKEECEELSVSLGLQKKIHFCGKRSDVYSLIKMADVSVLSSHWEGFGLVAVESMACEIPLIASNVEGLSDVVGTAGILFEKGNDQELANSILNLANDKKLYDKIVKKGILRAEEFNISESVSSTIALYEGLLCKK